MKGGIIGGIVGWGSGVLIYLLCIFTSNMDDPLSASWVHGLGTTFTVGLLLIGVIIGSISVVLKEIKKGK